LFLSSPRRYAGSVSIAPPFLTSVLDDLDRFNPEKQPQYPLNMRLSGPQKRSGIIGEEKNLLPMPVFEIRTVKPAPWPHIFSILRASVQMETSMFSTLSL
jgi:hypothetical protein